MAGFPFQNFFSPVYHVFDFVHSYLSGGCRESPEKLRCKFMEIHGIAVRLIIL
jgi:hypothetical protein